MQRAARTNAADLDALCKSPVPSAGVRTDFKGDELNGERKTWQMMRLVLMTNEIRRIKKPHAVVPGGHDATGLASKP